MLNVLIRFEEDGVSISVWLRRLEFSFAWEVRLLWATCFYLLYILCTFLSGEEFLQKTMMLPMLFAVVLVIMVIENLFLLTFARNKRICLTMFVLILTTG